MIGEGEIVTDENSVKNTQISDVSNFLSERSNTILVMGVFGSISIYLSRLSEELNWIIEIGIVSSLGLFVLLGIQIVYEMNRMRLWELNSENLHIYNTFIWLISQSLMIVIVLSVTYVILTEFQDGIVATSNIMLILTIAILVQVFIDTSLYIYENKKDGLNNRAGIKFLIYTTLFVFVAIIPNNISYQPVDKFYLFQDVRYGLLLSGFLGYIYFSYGFAEWVTLERVKDIFSKFRR